MTLPVEPVSAKQTSICKICGKSHRTPLAPNFNVEKRSAKRVAQRWTFFSQPDPLGQGTSPTLRLGAGGIGGPSAFWRMDVFFADTGMAAWVFYIPTGRFQKGYHACEAHAHPHASLALLDGSASAQSLVASSSFPRAHTLGHGSAPHCERGGLPSRFAREGFVACADPR